MSVKANWWWQQMAAECFGETSVSDNCITQQQADLMRTVGNAASSSSPRHCLGVEALRLDEGRSWTGCSQNERRQGASWCYILSWQWHNCWGCLATGSMETEGVTCYLRAGFNQILKWPLVDKDGNHVTKDKPLWGSLIHHLFFSGNQHIKKPSIHKSNIQHNICWSFWYYHLISAHFLL